MSEFLKLLNIVILLGFSSCSLFKKKGNWGKRALWPLSRERFTTALQRNITSPHVWAPAGAAAVLAAGNWDEKFSYWVAENGHVYEDHEAADRWSDILNEALKYEIYATALLTPSMGENGSWGEYFLNKTRGGATIATSITLARYSRDRITESFPRERPNQADNYSFPSGHANRGAAYNMASLKNYEYIEMDKDLKTGLRVTSTTMAFGVGLARVIGHRHYATDVLVGYALGSFLTGVTYDALINSSENEGMSFAPIDGGFSAAYALRF